MRHERQEVVEVDTVLTVLASIRHYLPNHRLYFRICWFLPQRFQHLLQLPLVYLPTVSSYMHV